MYNVHVQEINIEFVCWNYTILVFFSELQILLLQAYISLLFIVFGVYYKTK